MTANDMLKERITNIIKRKAENIQESVNKSLDKCKNFDKFYTANEHRYTIIGNLKYFEENILAKMEFIQDIDGINEYVSEYGTLCTRERFYYDKEILKFGDKELLEIVSCEIFNAEQLPRTSVSKSTLDNILSSTLLMMYSIGIIDEKLKYGVSFRNKLNNYVDCHKYKVFKANKKALKYNYENLRKVKKGTEYIEYLYIRKYGFSLRYSYI